MSDHIPFEIQSEIMKSLPVKSLIQFRSVSKQWLSFIDSPEFIKNYHINHTNPQHNLLIINHTNPQHNLLVRYKSDDTVNTYTSIADNNTFPQQKFPLTAPESLRLLRHTLTFSHVNGLLCFCGDIGSKRQMAIIWNPTVRKSVSIVIPNLKAGYKRAIVGFGVYPDTSEPKLVRISFSNKTHSLWEVDVFTLTTRVWKTVYVGAPFKVCNLMSRQVFVNGVIYFRAIDFKFVRVRCNFIISFDMKSEKFDEVCLPKRLVHKHALVVTKVKESLGLLEYYHEGGMMVCGVWKWEDGASKMFSKIYTVKVVDKSLIRVLEFRNNGEVVTELMDDDNYMESRIEVYEPLSGRTIGVGINGKRHTLVASLYTETLLLLDQSDSITI